MIVDSAIKNKADQDPDNMLDVVIVLRSGDVDSLIKTMPSTHNPFQNIETLADDLMFSCQIRGKDLDMLAGVDDLIEAIEDNSLQNMIDE